MQAFTTLTAPALVLAGTAASQRGGELISQIDTDQLVPARFLSRGRDEGFGQVLFHDLRRDAQGALRADFPLNHEHADQARILIAGANFGCGSSREAAVWALVDQGVRVVIAPSFGDIFFNNSAKNGLLAVALPETQVHALADAVMAGDGVLTVDLPEQRIHAAGHPELAFQIDPMRKRLLVAGMDEITYTLSLAKELAHFEESYDRRHPWL